jgi:hypothetical protein
MNWRILCLILGCVAGDLHGQWQDDFNNDTLLWNGDVKYFKLQNQELLSNCNQVNKQFGLSHALSINDSMLWSFDIKMLFNPSSLNLIDVFVCGDSVYLPNSLNGLFVRLGGTKDDVSLYEIKNGAVKIVLDGPDAFLNQSKNDLHLVVLKLDSVWTVSYKGNSLKDTYLLGKINKKVDFSTFQTGFYIKQSTSSFFYKHQFDNWYSGPWLKDSIAPHCLSVNCLNNKTLRLQISEPIHKPLKSSFISNHCNCSPDSIIIESNMEALQLLFQKEIDTNQFFNLSINQLKDEVGNESGLQTFTFVLFNLYTADFQDIIITELMVDPEPSKGLPELEYIEIKNVSKKFISTENLKISDPSSSIILHDTILFPDSFLVIYNGPSLNNSGDVIKLSNDTGMLLHQVKYSLSDYGDESKSQGGYSLEMIDPYQLCLPENWRASVATLGGTPGKKNSIDTRRSPDTVPPKLVNVVSKDLDIMIELSEDPDFNVSQAVFKLNGEQLKGGVLMGQFINFKLLNKLNPDTIQKIEVLNLSDCSGNFIPLQQFEFKTLSIPSQFDLVFNEVLFNPFVGGKDFIELYQTSERLFDFSEIFIADIQSGGFINTIYPLSSKPQFSQDHNYIVLSEDTNNVCENYTCGYGHSIFLKLPKMPSMPDNQGTLVLVNLKGEYIDSFTYSKEMHHPLYKNEDGVSLEKLYEKAIPSHPDLWYSASSESGYATPGKRNSQFLNNDYKGLNFSLLSKTVAPKPDGFLDLLVLEYELNKPDFVCSIEVFDIQGHIVKHLMNNATIGSKGTITWNGRGEMEEELGTGIYILSVRGFYPDGTVFKKNLSFALVNE